MAYRLIEDAPAAFYRHASPARVLVATAMWPDTDLPARGVVVQREVLAAQGLADVDVLVKAPGLMAYVRFARKLRRLAANGGYQLIHAHYGTAAVVAAVVARKIPLVVTLHGSDISGGTAPVLSKYWLQHWLTRFGVRTAKRVVVQSTEMLSMLPPAARAKAVVLSQGVDPRRLETVERMHDHRGPYVVFLGAAWRPEKRFHLAAAAMAQVRGLDLVALDSVQPDEVMGLIAGAACALLTSSREGLPVAVLEAVACGVPVVATDLPSLVELATTLPAGSLLTAGPDPSALADAVRAAVGLGRLDVITAQESLRALGLCEPDRTHALLAIYGEAVA